MPKKTLGLLSILIALTAVLVAVSLWQRTTPQQPLSTVNQNPTQPSSQANTNSRATATLTLSPSVLSASSQTQLNVIIDTGGQSVTAAQIELSFDPKKITNVDIAAPKTTPFFDNPLVLLKKIDTQAGRISFAIGINPTATAKTGGGTVAIISFTPKLVKGEQTTIQFLDQSLITAIGVAESVLKSASGATIMGAATSQVPVSTSPTQ